jgi:hypothetical protein
MRSIRDNYSGFRSRLNIARMAHHRTDAAQAVLSAVKIFVALLPDHTTRELWPSGLSVDIMLRFRSPCDARKPHTRPFRRIRPTGTNG